MVKKKKSVERTKEDKIKNNNKNNNKNTNTQITQIIFPPNMELRTKRKKRKGKSKAQKKKEEEKEELLEMLKSKLNEYDNLQEQAQQKNIPIPDELALSVINQEDLKTNEDIENYINDIAQKINALTELINKPVNMFSIKRQVRQGLGAIQPQIQPQIQPPLVNPSMIPTEEPTTEPTIKKELQKITGELEGEVGEKDLPLKPEPLKEDDLVNFQLKIGDKFVKIQTPKGFGKLFILYKKYIEDTDFITRQNQIANGVYHIPLEKYNQLINDRDSLKKKYNEWFNKLPNRLQYYMEKTNQELAGINADIFGNLELEPKELSKNLFRSQSIDFTEITQGNEKPEIEKAIQERGFKDKDTEQLRKDFDSFIGDMSGKINIIRDKISKSNGNKVKLDKLDTEINSLETQLESKYEALPEEVKLSAITENQRWEKRFNDVRNMISTARNPFTPIAPDPNILRPEPVVAEEPVVVKPNQRKLTAEQKEAKKVINNFTKSGFKKAKNISQQVANAIRKYFGDERGDAIIMELRRFGSKTKDEVKSKKQKLDEYMRGGLEAVNVLGVN